MSNLPLYLVSGVISGLAMFAGFTGTKLPLIANTRSAVIVLTITGFAMCSLGAIGAFIAKAPLHPLTIAGYVFGALALLAGVVQVFKLGVPYIQDPRNALIVITAAIIIKFAVARLSFLLPAK